uniref:non-specific serine/threonine protein kinase n=1 Tax=Haemonchus contortus TaxID=6289 RepID=A0A7I4YSR3_HAECO
MPKQRPTSSNAMSFDLESAELSSSSCSIDDKLPSTNNLIRGKESQYAVGRKLAQGRYGAVYEVLRKSDGKPFACKLEICGANSHGLDMDYVVMSQAAKRGCNHLVKSMDRGKIEDHFKFLIMPLLGDNLTKIRHQFVDGRLSLSTGLRLAFLALAPIQELHSIGYVHRDIKCSNFCLAPNSSRGDTKLVLIDYGVCRAYKDKSGNIKAPREQVRFRGTTRYASINAHNGEEQAPRDDLASWFYMMIEMLSGYLPWSHFHRDSINEVRAMKEHVQTSEGANLLFEFCPKVEFRRLQKYIDGLKYPSQPDYTFIAEMLQLAMKNNGVKMDEPYDWEE